MGEVGTIGQGLAGLLFAVALINACISDIREFRISNRCTVIAVVAFAVAAPSAGMGGGAILLHAGAGLAVFAAGFALYLLRAWGGGDVKLCAAAALMVGFAGLPRFAFVMALVGGVLAAVALVARRLPLAKAGPVKLWGERMASTGHVPYGVAIAAGGLDWLAVSWLPRLTG
jgi:prepilin peptidase CpaA